MSGMGQPLLPTPKFSSDNPYWRIPVISGLRRDYWQRLSAQDFLRASTWEITRRWDIKLAGQVRRELLMATDLWIIFTKAKRLKLVYTEKEIAQNA